MALLGVAVARGGDRLYTYEVPEDVGEGAVVRVPFRRELRLGVAVARQEQYAGTKLRPILEVLGVLPPDLLALLRFFHDALFTDWGAAAQAVLPPDVRERRERWYALAPGVVPDTLAGIRGPKARALVELLFAGPRPRSFLPAGDEVLTRLLDRGLVVEVPEPRTAPKGAPFPLTPEQEASVAALGDGGRHLLQGVTGSGKTEVYLEAVRRALVAGGGAIVLVPEIALTTQMVALFRERFGNLLVVQHSRLSEGERAQAYHRLLRGEARVVLGARSAILSPVRDLRLVVVDEEHEQSYQQEEAPRYHARQAAEVRAAAAGASLLLGSATPDVVTLWRAGEGEFRRHILRHRFGAGLAEVRVVDLRGRPGLLTDELIAAIEATRREGRQAILFFNRRGFGRTVLCGECGFSFPCPHCSVSLVYHAEDRRLVCHYCNHAERAPSRCPVCRGTSLTATGYGTERLQMELAEKLPGLRVQRLDQDTVRRKGSYEAILATFARGEADVLVGTQMVAKGLHFPNVGLSAVVLADLTLRFPDYRAAERAFQQVAQVAGRAGRGAVAGRVLIQTYAPDHHALRYGKDQDVDGFAAEELAIRRQLSYPPFCHLLLFGFSGRVEEDVRARAMRRAESLLAQGVRPLGPAPALVRKVRDVYRWQVLAKLPSFEAMVHLAERLRPGGVERGVREAVVFDPLSTL